MDFCVWKFYVSLSTFALCAVWLWVCLCVYIIYERERERERKMGHLSLIYIIFANVISHLNYLSLFYSEWEYLSNYIYYSTNTHNKFNMYICICLKWTNFEVRFLCTCGFQWLNANRILTSLTNPYMNQQPEDFLASPVSCFNNSHLVFHWGFIFQC